MAPEQKRHAILQDGVHRGIADRLELFLNQAEHLDKRLDDVGLYEDVLDLVWRHLGRPRPRVEAAPKPYDNPPDQVPKGEPDKRPRPGG